MPSEVLSNYVLTTALNTAIATCQAKITQTGTTNLLVAPAAIGGQPGIKPITDFQQKITATGNANLLLAPSAAGGQPLTKAVADFQPKITAIGVTNVLTAPSAAGGQPGIQAIGSLLRMYEVHPPTENGWTTRTLITKNDYLYIVTIRVDSYNHVFNVTLHNSMKATYVAGFNMHDRATWRVGGWMNHTYYTATGIHEWKLADAYDSERTIPLNYGADDVPFCGIDNYVAIPCNYQLMDPTWTPP
jgi:hypothetical protein